MNELEREKKNEFFENIPTLWWGWVGVRLKREGIYVYLELIHCYTVETTTTLSSNYPPIKNEFKT